MPTYRNDGPVAAPLGRFGMVSSGQTVTVAEFVDLGANTTFTLIGGSAPWDKLHTTSLPVSIASGLSKYEQIEIINLSGTSIFVVANGDTNNDRLIPVSNNRFFSFPKRIESLSVTGEGAGLVYVYGYKGN